MNESILATRFLVTDENCRFVHKNSLLLAMAFVDGKHSGFLQIRNNEYVSAKWPKSLTEPHGATC